MQMTKASGATCCTLPRPDVLKTNHMYPNIWSNPTGRSREVNPRTQNALFLKLRQTDPSPDAPTARLLTSRVSARDSGFSASERTGKTIHQKWLLTGFLLVQIPSSAVEE